MNLGINGGDGRFFKHKNNHTVVAIFIVLKKLVLFDKDIILKIWTCGGELQFTQKSTLYHRANAIYPYKST